MARTKQQAMKQSAKQQSKQPVKPAKPPARPTGHRHLYSNQAADSTIVWISGKMVAVDSEIVELVEAVNAIPGVWTTGSCQGSRDFPGHLKFAGPSAFAFFAAISMGMWPPVRRCMDFLASGG
jgi:hypothetical protein